MCAVLAEDFRCFGPLVRDCLRRCSDAGCPRPCSGADPSPSLTGSAEPSCCSIHARRSALVCPGSAAAFHIVEPGGRDGPRSVWPGAYADSDSQPPNQPSAEFVFDLVAEHVVVKNGQRVYVPAGETPRSIAATAVFSQKTVIVQPYTSSSVDVRLTIPPETGIRAMVAVFRGTNRLQT